MMIKYNIRYIPSEYTYRFLSGYSCDQVICSRVLFADDEEEVIILFNDLHSESHIVSITKRDKL
jgi:hypothetical protein